MFTRNNIGERIGFFRRLHNYTQKELGKLLGFSDKTCDVRVAQYESGDRVPKEEMLKKIAAIFGISPYALNIPNIRTWASRMHIFFAMEDKYGAEIKKIDDEYYLRIEKTYPEHPTITGVRNAVLQEWVDMYSALQKGEISREEYGVITIRCRENTDILPSGAMRRKKLPPIPRSIFLCLTCSRMYRILLTKSRKSTRKLLLI